MLGILFGFGCLYALYRVNRPHHYADCRSPRRHRARRPKGPFGSMAGFADRKLGKLFRLIDATPEQADEIRAAFADLRSEVLPLRGTLRGTRSEFAEAMRDDEVAYERLDAVFGLHRDALETAQKALRRALERVHGTLTTTQRTQVADHFARYAAAGPYR